MSSDAHESSAVHRPVLLDEVVSWLAPKPGSILVDGTVGAGGHAAALAALVGEDGRVIGLNFLGRRWDHTVCTRWIEERRTVDYVMARLHEASFDTEFVPKLEIPRSTWAG